MGLNYTKTTWDPRLGTDLNRFNLIHADNTSEYVKLTNVPTTISQQGTQITSGRLNNIETFLSAVDDKVLTAGVTMYVKRDTGSDSNSGTSSANAKKTLQSVLNALPPNLGGYTVTINISGSSSGDPESAVSFLNFHGGRINISGTYHARGIEIANCTRIGFNDYVYVLPNGTSTGLSVANSTVQFGNDLTVNGTFTAAGVYVAYDGRVVAGTIAVTGNDVGTEAAIKCEYAGRLYGTTLGISHVEYGLYAATGGRLCYSGATISNTSTDTTTTAGGRIHTGAQSDYDALIAALDTRLDAVEPMLSYVLTGSMTLYVDTTNGNDANPGTSASYPLKSLQAAANKIPKNLGGHNVTIYVGGTAKDDTAIFRQFHGGQITLALNTSAGTTSYETKSLQIIHCDRFVCEVPQLLITPATADSISNALQISQGSNVFFTTDMQQVIIGQTGLTAGFTTAGVLVSSNSMFCCESNTGDGSGLSIYATTKTGRTGIRVTENSRFYCTETNLINVANGMTAIQGGTLAYGTANFDSSVTTQRTASSGGRIYAGSQSSIPNY